jgi:carbohydrate binding protein with CBM5/12 domain/glycosyl hydrolase family 16
VPRHSAPQQPTRLRPRLIVTLVVAAAGLTTAVWLPARNDSADASERNRSRESQNQPRQRTTAFADEFGGQQGAVDSGKWSGGRDTRNARLDGNGNLVLAAWGPSSARLQTRESFVPAYGHVEARIKTPRGEGAKPALSLVGSKGGELNVLADPQAGEFHTYGLAWTPEQVVSLVDGQAVKTTKVAREAFDQTFSLVLSLGAPRRSDRPTWMIVDFVRVTTAVEPSGDPSPAPTTAPPSEEPTTPPTTAPTTEPPTTAPTTEPTTAPTTVPPTTPPTSAPVATEWAPFTDYVAGALVTYEGVEYQVQETHTSLPGWEPTALPSLFKKI